MRFPKGIHIIQTIFGVIFFFIGVSSVHADSIDTPLLLDQSSSDAYDFRNDPFLLEWTLRMENTEDSDTKTIHSIENELLDRWKEKQADLWDNLPTEPFKVNVSAYTAAADECGKDDGVTASGLKVTEKRTIACPPNFPFGTKIRINGVGEYRCEDRGGAIKGNRIDIYVETKKEAFTFGRQHLLAEVVH
jgi:3D (Asp-Asp-Asp) domain-containing protein